MLVLIEKQQLLAYHYPYSQSIKQFDNIEAYMRAARHNLVFFSKNGISR